MSDGEPEPRDRPVRRVLTIRNRRGLHARAAAKFVKCAEMFDAEITVLKADLTVSGCSIMGLMMLAAAPGSKIELVARGIEARAAVEAIAKLVKNRFDED